MVFTFINICAAASVLGQVVSVGTEAVEAPGSVDALMDTQTSRLTEREEQAFIYISADVVVPARYGEAHVTGAARRAQEVSAVRRSDRRGRR